MVAKKRFVVVATPIGSPTVSFPCAHYRSWALFGLAVCLPDHLRLWSLGFLVLLTIETAAYMLLTGPLEPRGLGGAGINFLIAE